MYCIEPKSLNRHHEEVNGSHHKPLIERRRRRSPDRSELAFPPAPSHNRRAGDQMRIRFQRWIELAEVALRKKPVGADDGNDS